MSAVPSVLVCAVKFINSFARRQFDIAAKPIDVDSNILPYPASLFLFKFRPKCNHLHRSNFIEIRSVFLQSERNILARDGRRDRQKLGRIRKKYNASRRGTEYGGITRGQLKTSRSYVMPHSSSCIMDLPALQTIPFFSAGMDSPHIGTEMYSSA